MRNQDQFVATGPVDFSSGSCPSAGASSSPADCGRSIPPRPPLVKINRTLWPMCVVFILIFCVPQVFADNSVDRDRSATYDQARDDYRIFLQQLKELNRQYKEVSGEMSKIVREEGTPTWDMGDASIGSTLGAETLTNFGDTDIQETDKEIVVKMDLPGVQKDKIRVSVRENKILKIEGEREERKEEKKEGQDYRYYKSERQHGEFVREVVLPSLVQEKGTDAQYKDGVLTVRILKEPSAHKEIMIPVK